MTSLNGAEKCGLVEGPRDGLQHEMRKGDCQGWHIRAATYSGPLNNHSHHLIEQDQYSSSSSAVPAAGSTRYAKLAPLQA